MLTRFTLICVLLVSLLLAACGAETVDPTAVPATETPAIELPEASDSAAQPAPNSLALQVLEETETDRLIKHSLGEVRVPREPKRIVALQDQNVLLPLLELGVTDVVGSVGAVGDSGEQMFRRSGDYDTSYIQYVGEYGAPNLESISKLNPDLIIGSQYDVTAENYDLLSQIAPTVVVEQFTQPIGGVMNDLALLTNRADAAASLKANYDARVAEVRALFEDPSAITFSVITPYNAEFYFEGSNYVYSIAVARDLGFQLPPLNEQAIAQGDYPTYSMELLSQADGDVLFLLDYNQESASSEYDVENIRSSALFGTLNAVKQNQVFVIDPSKMGGMSYSGLLGMLEAIETNLGQKSLNTDWSPEPLQ